VGHPPERWWWVSRDKYGRPAGFVEALCLQYIKRVNRVRVEKFVSG